MVAKRDTNASGSARASKPTSKAANTRKGKQVKATAAKAAARARRAGATGRGDRGMTRLEKRMRDTAIIAARHAGESEAAIAEEWGITERSVRRVLTAFDVGPSPLDQRPVQVLEEVARAYRRQVVDFARIAAANAEGNPSVAVGAMKAGADALERYVDLMSDVGNLPENMRLYRSEAEVVRFAREMSRRVQALVRGEVTAEELLAFLRENTVESSAVVEAEGFLELDP